MATTLSRHFGVDSCDELTICAYSGGVDDFIGPKPCELKFHCPGELILSADQVVEIRDTLTQWLDRQPQ